MFDVMIIEDDQYVRERLKRMIEWEKRSVKFVCEAADGNTAKELYSIYRPQIIITDINIPMISGLDLMEELQKENPELLFIVITGYSDFELARRSVSLHAFSMLSKPIRPEVMNQCISEAVQHLENEREKKKEQDVMRKLVSDNLQQMQSFFMSELLRKEPVNEEISRAKMEQLKISCKGPRYAVATLAIHVPAEKMSQREELLFFLRDLADKYMNTEPLSSYNFLDSHFRLTCIISMEEENPDNLIEDLLLKISDQMNFIHSIGMYAGVGVKVGSIMQLHYSAQCALAALNYQSVFGEGNILHYKNMETIDSANVAKDTVYDHLLKLFRIRDFESISNCIANRIVMLQSDRENGKAMIRNFLFEYLTNILNEAKNLGMDQEKIGSYASIIVEIFQENDVEGVCVNNVLNLTRKLIEELNSTEMSNSNFLITKAKEYIRANLSDKNLDLEKCSEHVALSKHYFCKLFHKSENCNFNSFIRQERIKKAKELLLTTELKMYEISDQCGFTNSNYFSYVFKQETGEKPLDYQKKRRK